MKRAIDLGPVEAAAIKTSGGKIRLRLLFTADQLESMLIAARSGDDPQDDDDVRNVTQCDAPEKTQNREDLDDEDDARARSSPVPPTAPVGRGDHQFVIEGTRAWDAWLKAGHPPKLSVRREQDGRVRTGWHFPTLFPPKQPTELT